MSADDRGVVDLELSPTARTAGVAYLHDLDLDAALSAGDRVTIRDEGGQLFAATVEQVEPTRLGNKYRVRFAEPGNHERAVAERISNLNLEDEFTNSGAPWVEADEQGRTVVRKPGGTTSQP